MSRSWTIILIAIVMVVQTFSVISDVLPSHLGDIHQHEQDSHAIIDDLPSSTDIGLSESTEHSADLSDNCQGNHCHGSHLLVTTNVGDYPALMTSLYDSSYSVKYIAKHVDSFLRPPIA